MSAQLLLEATGHIGMLIAALCIGAGAKALASVMRTWVREASRTRRFSKALEGSRPDERPEIIKACSQLEGKPADAPDHYTSAAAITPRAHPRPRVLIPHSRHDHELREDS